MIPFKQNLKFTGGKENCVYFQFAALFIFAKTRNSGNVSLIQSQKHLLNTITELAWIINVKQKCHFRMYRGVFNDSVFQLGFRIDQCQKT